MSGRFVRQLLLVGMATGALSACLSASIEPRYYTLAGAGRGPRAAETGQRDPAGTVMSPVSIVVARFETQFIYDRLELVYRPSARELRFDAYRLWAAKPGRMLRDAVAEHLRASGRFAAVSTHLGAAPADFELRGEILAIEEVDVDKTHWLARLAMRFELVETLADRPTADAKTPDGEVLWRHAFATERPVSAQNPAEVVATLDAILADELGRLGEALSQYVAARAPRAPQHQEGKSP